MLNFKEFQASKIKKTIASIEGYRDLYETEEDLSRACFLYEDDLVIETTSIDSTNSFKLVLGFDELESENLEELEKALFEYYAESH